MIAAKKLLLIAGLAGLAASAAITVSRLETPRVRESEQRAIRVGLADELVISCGAGKAVLTRLPQPDGWCDARHVCHQTLDDALRSACAA